MKTLALQKFTCISRHARKRIGQRTRLTGQEVADLLDHKLFVDSGHLPGLFIHHLVFYSVPDETCFVAVRDSRCGTVLTVLPLTYQARLTWAISPELCIRAKALIQEDRLLKTGLAQGKAPGAQPPVETAHSIPVPKCFVMFLHYLDLNECLKTKKLLTVPADHYGYDVDKLLSDVQLPGMLERCLESRGVQATRWQALSIRCGRSKTGRVIEFH